MAGAYDLLLEALMAYLFRPTWRFTLFAPKQDFVVHFPKLQNLNPCVKPRGSSTVC